MSAPDDALPPSLVGDRLEVVRQRIVAAGGDLDHVDVLAVTKGFGVGTVELAMAVGFRDAGENYAQELAAKAESLQGRAPRWHFIGRLQRNKVRKVAPWVHLWQSVDRLSLAQEIVRRAPGAALLVQVDAFGEPQKGGCPPGDVPTLVAELIDLGLDVRGLMAVGLAGDPERSRSGFRQVRRLADDLALPVRSMGMTGDLEVAVQEGATLVRVGTALFGDRPARRAAGD